MDYINGFIDAFPPCFDEEESQNEAAAQHQMEMDFLYSLGCEFSIPDNKMRELCQLVNISFDELLNHSTNSTESTYESNTNGQSEIRKVTGNFRITKQEPKEVQLQV